MYEIIYDGKGKDGKPFLPGLIDVEALRKKKSPTTISTLGGLEGSLLDSKWGLGGPLGGHCGGFVGPLLGNEKPDGEKVTGQKTEISEKNAHIGIPPQPGSYEVTGHSQPPSITAKKEKDNPRPPAAPEGEPGAPQPKKAGGNGSEKLLLKKE